MSDRNSDAKALKPVDKLANAQNWKHIVRWNGEGFYELKTEDTNEVRVRLFFTPQLLDAAEEILYRQIVNATRVPGVRMVVITPDAHYGYGVPVGCVLITDAREGAVAMGPVGYDIGCGMMSARSGVKAEAGVQPGGDGAREHGVRREEPEARSPLRRRVPEPRARGRGVLRREVRGDV